MFFFFQKAADTFCLVLQNVVLDYFKGQLLNLLRRCCDKCEQRRTREEKIQQHRNFQLKGKIRLHIKRFPCRVLHNDDTPANVP